MYTKILGLGLGALALWACNDSNDTLGETQSEILYEGNCVKADCADLERPETNCTDTAPRFTCSDERGTCALSFECPSSDDPGAAVSFSPCADEECGERPTTAEAAGCAAGKKYTGATCGKLNGSSTCKWAAGCVTVGEPIPVDPADVGPACGNETNLQCPADKPECASLPIETGIQGPHCFAGPCALLDCPGGACITLESSPPIIRCPD